jgi:hypothetical protein
VTALAVIVFAVLAAVTAYLCVARRPRRALEDEMLPPDRESAQQIDPQLGDWRGRGPDPR